METFVFKMGSEEFTVSVKVTGDDKNDLKAVVLGLAGQIERKLTDSEKKILDEAAMGVEDDHLNVTIKLKYLQPLRAEIVDSFSDLIHQREKFDKKIESALYFDFSIDYPTKFKVNRDIMEYYNPRPNTTEVYCIRLLAGNCIRFFPPTENLVATEDDSVKPFRQNKKHFLRWSILSPRESTGSEATQKNEVYNSIVYAWNLVKNELRGPKARTSLDFDSPLFIEQMGEIQKLMKEKDQQTFQDKEITVLRRVDKLENIFNGRVFDKLSKYFKDPNERKTFLRWIDKYLGAIEYYETTGSLRAEIEGIARRRNAKNQLRSRGGYREPPKRKKRKNTKRKKRKNTKRKNTKRKNTRRNKRKNTKRR